jgi:hypothetical protein
MSAQPLPVYREAARNRTREAQVGQLLDGLAEFGVVTLHHRRIKRTRSTIDHVVVAPSGVYVVDTRMWNGRVELRHGSNLLRRNDRLVVAGRDRTRLADRLTKESVRVRRALGGLVAPVHGVLCFVDDDWPLWAKPIEVRGATVMWPKELERRAKQLGKLDGATIRDIAARLQNALPPR